MAQEIGIIETLSQELAAAVSPLADVFRSPEALQGFLEELGWLIPDEVGAIGLDPTLVDDILSALQAVLELDREKTDQTTIAATYATLLGGLAAFITHLYDVRSRIGDHLDAAFLTASKMPEELPRRTLDYLILEHCYERSTPMFYGLVALGLFELLDIPLDEASFTAEHTRHIVHYDRLPLLFTNPPELFRQVYGWGTTTANLTLLIERLYDFVLVLGLPAGLEYPIYEKEVALTQVTPPEDSEAENPELRLPIYRDDESAPTMEAGVTLMSLPPQDINGFAGLALCPYATEEFTAAVPLDADERWFLTTTGTLDVVLGIGILLRPNQGFSILTDIFGSSTTASGTLSTEVHRQAPPDDQVTLFGSSAGTTLRAHALYVKIQALLESKQQELFLEVGAEQGHLNLSFASADGFLQAIVPEDSLSITFDFGLGWSSRHGLYFHGGAGLEVLVPVNVDVLGILQVDSIYLALQLEFRLNRKYGRQQVSRKFKTDEMENQSKAIKI
jgi:hypothetical protein